MGSSSKFENNVVVGYLSESENHKIKKNTKVDWEEENYRKEKALIREEALYQKKEPMTRCMLWNVVKVRTRGKKNMFAGMCLLMKENQEWPM